MNDVMLSKIVSGEVKILEKAPLLKLDLGSADRPREGFESVDLLHPAAQHKVDLFKFPFPWADNSVEEINCSHFLEHLPACEVEWKDMRPARPPEPSALEDYVEEQAFRENFLGKDFLIAFLDECWRVLVPDGNMWVTVPNARCNRAFQDPTHRRFFVAESFLYFSAEWRKINGLDHYKAKCDFGVEVAPIIPQALSLLSPDAQARVFNENWNTVLDWYAHLKVKK